MTPLDFSWKHIGDIVTAPQGVGGECVDLANLWLLEAYQLPHVFANAIDWKSASIRGFRWVPNGPYNAPSAGDLVVWEQNAYWHIGPYGHIALVLSADAMHLATLDQNWPNHAPVRLQLHDYQGVIGWQHKGG